MTTYTPQPSMSDHESSNKATVRRLQDAMNGGDAELISQTIDEVFEPDVKQHTPVCG